MKKKVSSKVVFKPYAQNQLQLLPPSLDELISEHHPVRVVNAVLDKLDLSVLLSEYKGGGSSSYHPKMLLKVLIYSYLRNVYSSRKIEESLQENIHLMWLSGMSQPDHSTINEFRSQRLKSHIKDIFKQVVLLLSEEGLVNMKELYTDGTKLEAQANRYTFVWGKAIKTRRTKIEKQLEELWSYVEKVYTEEKLEVPCAPDFKEVTAEKVQSTIDKINACLQEKTIPKKIAQKLSYAQKNWPSKLKEYEVKESILNGRNSYSKTDTDATFMRMKEDHMKNGQLKPGYNVQISTNNKIVVNYSTGQTTADTVLYQAHHEEYHRLYDAYPDSDTADSGYGSEENYQYLEDKKIAGFVKYSYFHKEQKKQFKEHPKHKENLHYNAQEDALYCPMGQKMDKIGNRNTKTTTGFVQHSSLYQAKNCEKCPMRGVCHDSQNNRIVQRNENLERHKQAAKERLTSELGKQKRGQRCVEVEGTFAQLKHNKGFKRFFLRGNEKINLELGLVFLSMNLDRMVKLKTTSMGEACPKTNQQTQNQDIRADKSSKKAS